MLCTELLIDFCYFVFRDFGVVLLILQLLSLVFCVRSSAFLHVSLVLLLLVSYADDGILESTISVL